MALLLADGLELGELLSPLLITLSLLSSLLSGTLLLLTEDALLLLTLFLLADLALLVLLATKSHLSLKILLCLTAALLELVGTTGNDILLEGLVKWSDSGESVGKLKVLRVLGLGILEDLVLGLLVSLDITLALRLVISWKLLGLLLSEGTLKVINTLAGNAELLIDVVLLSLKLGELDSANAVGVKAVEIFEIDTKILGTDLEIGNLLLKLVLANAVKLSLHALLLTILLLLGETLVLSLLELCGANALSGGLLLLLAGDDVGGVLLALGNDLLAGEGLAVLLLGTSLSLSQSSITSLDASLVVGWVDILAGDVKGSGQAGKLGANDLRWSVLETLDGGRLGLSGASTRSGVNSLCGGEDVSVEGKDTSGVVHADGEISLLVSVHDELLDGVTGDLEWCWELREVLDELEIDGLVDLGQLLEESGKDNLLEWRNVLGHLLIGTDLCENWGDLLADRQWVEVDLEDVVKLADLRAGTLEKTLRHGILEENSTGWCCGHAEEVCKARVLVLLGLININQSTAGSGSADDWNRKGGKQDERSSLAEISLRSGWVLGLLALSESDNLGGLAEEVVVSRPGSGVEEVVLSDQKDTGKLLVVVGHHDVLWWALAQGEKGVDILNRAESLLPELELHSNVQLLETGLQVALQGIWVVQVDGVHHGAVLGGSLNVVAEKLAESAELGLASVLLAESECLHGSALVHDLEARIVAEDVENGAVGLPKELQPWGDNRTVGAVLGDLAGDGRKEDRLWGLGSLKIVDASGGLGRLETGLDLIGLCLCVLDLVLGQLDELLEDKLGYMSVTVLVERRIGATLALVSSPYLNSRNVGVLGDVLVLVKSILGELSLLLLDGLLNQKEHNRLQ